MATEIKAPNAIPNDKNLLFLAGSIEMGVAEQWQERVVRALVDTNWTILNPRRDDWDSSWTQSIKNEKFVEQVEWELEGMERARQIAMYFSPGTKSPITLLELGLHVGDGKVVVCCPDGFWRKGNVEVVCRRYGVLVYSSLDLLTKDLTVSTLLERIISGGQTGADRAGLEAAEQLGIPTGGWCPKRCRTENGVKLDLVTRFGLRETPEWSYGPRTHYNVRDSDGTVWFGDCFSPGGRMTSRLCLRLGRPFLVNPTADVLRTFVRDLRIRILNVAGNRERTNPGIGARVKRVLVEALGNNGE